MVVTGEKHVNEYIAPLIKAVQQLTAMVKSLQQEMNDIKGITTPT